MRDEREREKRKERKEGRKKGREEEKSLFIYLFFLVLVFIGSCCIAQAGFKHAILPAS
jgi:hypothetical protein